MIEARLLVADDLDHPAKDAMKSSVSPLIRIRETELPVYAQTLTQKRELLESQKAGDCFIWAWGGRWRTDVFFVTPKQIEFLLT